MFLISKVAVRTGFTALSRWSLLLGLIGGSGLALGLFGQPEPGLSQTVQLAGTFRQPAKPSNVSLPAPTVAGASMLNRYTAAIVTQQQTLTLRGTAPSGAMLTLHFYTQRRRQVVQAMVQTDGSWSIPLTDPLPEGRTELYLEAIASTDSRSRSGLTLIVLVDRTRPTVHVEGFSQGQSTALMTGSLVSVGDRLLGQVDGTGSSVQRLTYRMDEQTLETPIPVSADGCFNLVLTARDLAPGKHRLTLTATDEAGNQSPVGPYFLRVSATTPRPLRSTDVLLLKLLADTGSNPKLVWTNKPTVVGYVVGTQAIAHLEVRLLPHLVSAFTGKGQPASVAEDASLPFQDMTAVVQPNGTFGLKDDFLRRLDYANLDDGPYTLEFRGRTNAMTPFAQRLEFVLDRTPPELQLSNIDGIAWDWGTRLQGSVHENLSDVQVAYQFVQEKGGVVAQGSFRVQGTRLNLLLPEFVKTNRRLAEETNYYLRLQARDQAGNSQSLQYTFFIPSDRRVVDDDVLIPPKPASTGTPPKH